MAHLKKRDRVQMPVLIFKRRYGIADCLKSVALKKQKEILFCSQQSQEFIFHGLALLCTSGGRHNLAVVCMSELRGHFENAESL